MAISKLLHCINHPINIQEFLNILEYSSEILGINIVDTLVLRVSVFFDIT